MTKTLYYGGDIITMEENSSFEAMLVEDGRIIGLGEKSELEASADSMVDLQGKTLMPSFIDAHSHITSWAKTMVVAQLNDLISLEEIKEAMINFVSKSQLKADEWAMGFGYDQNLLSDKKHPTKQFLDSISLDMPIVVVHASGHMGVANSKALALLGLDKNTPQIDGGVIGKDAKGELTGYLEEMAFTSLAAKMPRQTLEQSMDNIIKVEKEYLKYGVTTIQDGFTTEKEWKILSEMAQNNKFTADIVCYVDLKDSSYLMKNVEYKNKYNNNLKIGGYKIFLDGSPQGRTAWMKGGYEDDREYCGYPIYTDKAVIQFVKKALSEKQQLLTHCNGDAACQQIIDAFIVADKQYHFTNSVRPVMVHAQLTTAKQLRQMSRLDMIASFFVAHIYYWGDVHIKNFGARGENISAVGSALDADTVVTFHQDCPVLPPDMFFSVWCACTRKTKSGTQLNEKEKVTVMEALQAVTINAAYQYFEEDKKGSINIGKNADFIIIDKNPLKCELDDIPNIKILETIKDGKTVFKL